MKGEIVFGSISGFAFRDTTSRTWARLDSAHNLLTPEKRKPLGRMNVKFQMEPRKMGLDIESPSMENSTEDNSGKISSDTSTSARWSNSGSRERNEIEEVQKFSREDTKKIQTWRFVIFGVLAATAVAVTVTTLKLLRDREDQRFIDAFDKFGDAVGQSARLHQKILRNSFKMLADTLAVDAVNSGTPFPYYNNDYYEIHAGIALNHTGAEFVTVFPLVEEEERETWLNYSTEYHSEWARAGHMIKYGNLDRLDESNYVPAMLQHTEEEGWVPDDEWYEYWPMWLYSPPPVQYGAVNWNLINVPDYENIITAMRVLDGEALISPVRKSVSTGTAFTEEEHDQMHSRLKTGSSSDYPHSFVWFPIYEKPDNTSSKLVATLGAGFAWDVSLRDLLPEDVKGVIAVLSNNCNQTYTFEISGSDAFFLGYEDLHESKYDWMMHYSELSLLSHPLSDETHGHCEYSLEIYPSSKFAAVYDSSTPEVFSAVVFGTFFLVLVVFVVYDRLVYQRNIRLVQNAARSNAVVSSLFPAKIREKLLEQQEIKQQQQQQQTQLGTKSKMKNFLTGGLDNQAGCKPLADLFLETTILFADITGFTAWSSVREPSQVFTLLETVYSAFDGLAKSRKVFKVETVGDCYVAASGIPEPNKHHASTIIRFARDCVAAFSKMVTTLEITLGPGTGNLGIRAGVHSGPITAGVLRGEKARFQLFGDTMNVTARMESSGEPGRIQISPETAEILKATNKGHWIEARKDLVNAKGKGMMQTYWVKQDPASPANTQAKASLDANGGVSEHGNEMTCGEEEKKRRLVNWNVEMLTRLIKQIVARRQAQHADSGNFMMTPKTTHSSTEGAFPKGAGGIPMDEVKEVIHLPDFDHRVAKKQVDVDEIQLDQKVVDQLRLYVTTISHLYYENPFHNFEHASHVVMSVIKLMSRIVAPEAVYDENNEGPLDNVEETLHDHTYGITSDPLTQFACAFSALIHDVDHRGVPNTQLIVENEELGFQYENRSVAEQNSLDLSWELLMDKRYDDLRDTLCETPEELSRLRELVVNVVLATDIMDKDLKVLRNDRWAKAFDKAEESAHVGNVIEDRNRKATIVIEHLIQASDVAHTMQHWHVYRQFNQRLFEELYRAHKEGRGGKDPTEFWYKGELGFFDFYIIPLAKKLKECGVFGVSSGEYLNYAMSNRMEWERRGEEMVAEMSARLHAAH
eukprot:Nitzschia sp. Nitz4//scaffold296_size27349//382//4345//NITZ4_008196-RA/size27349-snap-gene-0.39-mRNA-1//1//CDS//3329546261//5393//frame0